MDAQRQPPPQTELHSAVTQLQSADPQISMQQPFGQQQQQQYQAHADISRTTDDGRVSLVHNQYHFSFPEHEIKKLHAPEIERFKEFVVFVRVLKCESEHYDYEDYPTFDCFAVETLPTVVRVLFYGWSDKGLYIQDLQRILLYPGAMITSMRVTALPMPNRHIPENVLTLICEISRQSLLKNSDEKKDSEPRPEERKPDQPQQKKRGLFSFLTG